MNNPFLSELVREIESISARFKRITAEVRGLLQHRKDDETRGLVSDFAREARLISLCLRKAADDIDVGLTEIEQATARPS